jgi:nucleotide-binding universal stress UspA family protein
VVPLDGTALAAAIVPDAQRLAGPDGVLILVRDVDLLSHWDTAHARRQRAALDASRDYLNGVANRLQEEDVKVETQTTIEDNVSRAIDEASMIFDADMIAVATHERGGHDRLQRESVAWKALVHSPVPVLIRHIGEADAERMPPEPGERQIMVPLDGSMLAERALPLARELAAEWKASIWLVHVVSRYPITGFPRTEIDPKALTDEEARRSSQRYLDRIGSELEVDVRAQVLSGAAGDKLVATASSANITDVVISSHGRSGLARVILGSVAAALLDGLDLPIIVISALATESINQAITSAE